MYVLTTSAPFGNISEDLRILLLPEFNTASRNEWPRVSACSCPLCVTGENDGSAQLDDGGETLHTNGVEMTLAARGTNMLTESFTERRKFQFLDQYCV